jgi:hypothetical protein
MPKVKCVSDNSGENSGRKRVNDKINIRQNELCQDLYRAAKIRLLARAIFTQLVLQKADITQLLHACARFYYAAPPTGWKFPGNRNGV